MAGVAADWYFFWGVLGPPLGFLLVLDAIPLLIYGFCARNARRGLIASGIALILYLGSVLLSAILWIELVSGRFRYGDPVDYHDPQFMVYEVIAAFEALALLTSLLSVLRQRARHTAAKLG
jgi:hypothetical protein